MADTWNDEVDALLARWGPPRAAQVPDAVTRWLRHQADGRAVLVGAVEDIPADAQVVAVSAGLMEAEDSQALLDALADALPEDGRLLVAVPWCTPVEGSRRAFHPASLLGLLGARFQVQELVARDGLLAARAVVTNDPSAREHAALACLRSVQPEVERLLGLWSRARGELSALGDADVLSWTAVSELHDAEQAVRRQRNELRARLREQEEEHRRLAAVAEQAEAAAAELQVRAAALSDRIERIERSRAWRLGRLLADPRARLWSWAALPGKLWRVLRGAR